MIDILTCIPWPSTGIATAVGLIAGYTLGVITERHHGKAHR